MSLSTLQIHVLRVESNSNQTYQPDSYVAQQRQVFTRNIQVARVPRVPFFFGVDGLSRDPLIPSTL